MCSAWYDSALGKSTDKLCRHDIISCNPNTYVRTLLLRMFAYCLQGGAIVQIYHKHLEAYMAAVGLPGEALQEDGPCRVLIFHMTSRHYAPTSTFVCT